MLSQNEIKNNWPQIKSLIHGHWNKVTEAELEKTQGNIEEMDKLVSSKYGENAPKYFEQDLEKICNTFTAMPKTNKVQKDTKVNGGEIKTALDEYQSPQNPKRETLTPQMNSKK